MRPSSLLLASLVAGILQGQVLGAILESGGIVPPTSLDSTWRPSNLVVPTLYGSERGPEGVWRTQRLSEYADTVRVHLRPDPTGGSPALTPGPGLDFLLFTRDGGALTGGRLWRRNLQDIVSVIAVRIPPSQVGALRAWNPPFRPRIPERGNVLRFDAAGRSRRAFGSPIFYLLPGAP